MRVTVRSQAGQWASNGPRRSPRRLARFPLRLLSVSLSFSLSFFLSPLPSFSHTRGCGFKCRAAFHRRLILRPCRQSRIATCSVVRNFFSSLLPLQRVTVERVLREYFRVGTPHYDLHIRRMAMSKREELVITKYEISLSSVFLQLRQAYF